MNKNKEQPTYIIFFCIFWKVASLFMLVHACVLSFVSPVHSAEL